MTLLHMDLGGNPLPELGDVADDAHHPATLAQPVEHGHHLFEGVLVQGAESLIHEERLHPGPGGLRRDDVGEAQREREAGQERLAARQCRGVPVLASPRVAGQQPESGPARTTTCVGVHQRVPAGGHREQALAGRGRDLL